MVNSKRGQTTLFIIIAVIIVAVALLAFVILPSSKPIDEPIQEITDPQAYITDCINLELEPIVETISEQGGYLKVPELNLTYNGKTFGYLCYINMNNKPCYNQQPLLKRYVEEQLTEEVRREDIVRNCIDNFKKNAEKKGWEISTCPIPSFSIILTEGKVNVPTNCEIILSKGEDYKRFDNLEIYLDWPLYDFIEVSRDIVWDEIHYSDFEHLAYMILHPEFTIDKFRAPESKVYTIRKKISGDMFIFAVRNYVQSPGI
ncbi:MAG: hypothetical protein JSW08_00185 [archaeon]|nr:MAG: hypothetical protein JSW08_00185 [archaeon]